MQLGIGLFFFFLGVFFEGAKMSKIPNLPATKHVTQGKGTFFYVFFGIIMDISMGFFHRFLDLKDFSQETKMHTGCLPIMKF